MENKMEIIIAEHAGFCFGVKRIIEMAEEELENGPLTSFGQIIHNLDETNRLREKGLVISEKLEEISTKNVLIRAHGLSKREKDDIIKDNYALFDGTCPVLIKIYEKIQKKEDEGYGLLIIGDEKHPEIIAIKGHSKKEESVQIVNTKEEAEKVTGSKLYVISQTTNTREKFETLSKIILDNNADVVVDNTICMATRNRQEKAVELAKQVDAMIIIGGKNSSNSNKLAEMARSVNENTYFIENAKDLPLAEVLSYKKVGLSAGASTPDWVIEEVVNIMEDLTQEELMDQIEDSMQQIRPREIVNGTVIYVTEDEVMVNIGYQSDGIISLGELSSDSEKTPKDLFEEGDDIEVYVIKLDDGEGNVVLSTRRVEAVQAWKDLVVKYENEENVTATINRVVKGGLIAEVEGITAFMPGSHVSDHFVKNLEKFVGEELESRIINLDERKRRLVISHKVVLEEKKKEIMDKAWESIEVDAVLTGKVQRLVDFGAFVDLGGVDGLIHISDISWNRIGHPSEVLEEGQEVEVKVLRANRERNRISLGLKQLEEKPFEKFMSNHNEGDVIKGEVVNLVDFGAFVRLEEGVEGLVHISEIAHRHIEKPSDELNIGQEVEVKILDINPEERRIALSIKATQEAPEKPERPRAPRLKRDPKPRPKREGKQQESLFDDSALNTDLGSLLDDIDLG